MKIQSIKIWKENLKLSRPYTIAYETVSSVESAFVLLEASNGQIGIGAASPSKKVVGKNVDDTIADLESISDQIKGLPLDALPAILKNIKTLTSHSIGALTAMDIAFHDLFCKNRNISIADYYGRHFDSMPTSITIGIMGVEETLAEAKEYLERGFDHLKVKLGLNLEEDIERLTKLRETYGSAIKIRVDANQGYAIDELHRLYQATKKFDLELIEQPISESETLLLRNLPAEMKATIAADEYLKYPIHAIDLVEGEGCCGIFNIKLMKCGGIREAKTIVDIAQLKNIDLMWGCNDESIVSITAALHAAFSSKNTKYIDLDGSLDLAKDVVSGGFRIENGRMYLLDRAGLGVMH